MLENLTETFLLIHMQDLLEELNLQQREAVMTTEGPLLILAGAGSGKTRVITYRITNLMDRMGVPPESILAVTFTNKAADQMKQRVAKSMQHEVTGRPQISTFHSFCVRVLRREIHALGYSKNFSIYDEDAQLAAVKTCIRELGLEDQFNSPRSALSRISYAKNRGLKPETLYKSAVTQGAERLASVFHLYNRKLRQGEALDFDDLLLKTVELFEMLPEVCTAYNQRLKYLLVDEFQDTNRLQYSLIRQLTRLHQNLCAVGDEDQSIYRWRGAALENILNFEEDYHGARIIRLEQNYRSTQRILDAASAVVSHNRARKGKQLYAVRPGGHPVGFYEAPNGEEEGFFVARKITELRREDISATVGVLYRTNAQSRVLEEAMRRFGIDYHVVGGTSFYDRAEVKNILAYARLANNPKDSAALARIINVPPRGLGKVTLTHLEAITRQSDVTLADIIEKGSFERTRPPDSSMNGEEPFGESARISSRSLLALRSFRELLLALREELERLSLPEFFRAILSRTGYLRMLEAEGTPESQGRVENLEELVNAASEGELRDETLTQFLDHAALLAAPDQYKEKSTVALMTLHTAKGLEFSQVFLVGLEERLLPHSMSMDEEEELEEERRLCYVGMTRAKDRLYLTRARRRRSYGNEFYIETEPSRFLMEIPSEILERLSPAESFGQPRNIWRGSVNSREEVERFIRGRSPRPKFPAGRKPVSASHWPEGTRVRHPKYGRGTILNCEGNGEDSKLTIHFHKQGVIKKIMEKYISLEHL